MNDSEKNQTPRWPGDPAALTVEGVDFEAVAHVIANTCCWGGRSRRFHSLAQHAVTVSAAAERLGGMSEKDGQMLSLHGLLADAWRAWFRNAAAGRSGPGSEKARREAAAVQRTVLEAAGADPELPGNWTLALELTQRMAEAALYRDLSDAGIELGTRDSGTVVPAAQGTDPPRWRRTAPPAGGWNGFQGTAITSPCASTWRCANTWSYASTWQWAITGRRRDRRERTMSTRGFVPWMAMLSFYFLTIVMLVTFFHGALRDGQRDMAGAAYVPFARLDGGDSR